MRRALPIVVAAAIFAVLPTGAGAADWRGVVVAKDIKRGTVATASLGGVVRTVRASARVGGLRLGQRLLVKASPVADGTFRAQQIRVAGLSKKAWIRATVVRQQPRLGRTIVSAGGSIFSLRSVSTRALAGAGDGALAPGDQVIAQVNVADGQLQANAINEVGHTSTLELQGIFLEVADTTFKLAVVHRGLVEVAIPATLTLPALKAGDEVALVVSVGTDGSFTLVSVQGDQGPSTSLTAGVDYDEDDEEIEVEGILMSLTDTSVTVQPGEGASAMTCYFAAGTSLPPLVPGTSRVEMECALEGTTLVLRELESEDGEDGEDEENEENDEDEEEEEEED